MKYAFRMTVMTLTVLGLLFAAETVLAQASHDSIAGKDAEQLYQNKDWAGAAGAYHTITEREPTNGRAWYRLGYALHALGKYDEAVKAFYHSVEIGKNPQAMYNLACAYARLSEKDKAFEWLNRAVQAGFSQSQQLSADEDLTSLRGDARFSALVAEAQRNANPCGQPLFRQFDFWVGEWEVKAGGKPAGTNSVQLVSSSCALLENWTGNGGGDGKSLNYYDASTGKWHQLWVGSGGGALALSGAFTDGAMRLAGETLNQNGSRVRQKLTFFRLSPDHVRQLWEQSTDEGKTWTVVFDGDYLRKK